MYRSSLEDFDRKVNIITGKSTENRPLGRPRRRLEDNIRMDLKEIGIFTRNWLNSDQDRDYWRALVNAALNLRIPSSMELVIKDPYILFVRHQVHKT